MNVLAPYFKAVVAFVAPAAVVLTSAVTEASIGGVHITQGELVTAVCATIITGAAVYAVPNKPAQPDGRHEA
jgi:small-conductance mechanosensitive channel